MEYTTIMQYYYSAAAAAALLAVIALLWRRRRRRRWSQSPPPMPPGPPGLPLLGNLLSLSPPLHVHFTKLAETYGPIHRVWLGSKLGVVISSPALVREALRDNDLAMANHDPLATARVMVDYVGNLLFSPAGPTWRMLRRILVQELLSSASLDALYDLRRREVRATVAHLRASAGEEVDLGTQMFVTVLNVMTGVGWGGSMRGEERSGTAREFRELVGEITKLLGVPNVSDFFPALERFDLQGLQGKMKTLMARLDRFFCSIITDKKKMMMGQTEQRGGRGKDFLDYLLTLEEEEGGDIKKTPLTMSQVKGLLMSIIVGGTDTTSSTLEWAMAEMLRAPEIMRRVQQELDRVVGKDNTVEESHLPNLRYLGAVIKEVVRLHPVAPLLVPHTPSESCTIGGYTVPKGSKVFFNVWAIQRDPSLWKDPLKFDPERFLGSFDVDFRGKDFIYFPFGSGRRICAGIPLAERMMMHTLASVLHSFDLRLPEGTKVDLAEGVGLILKKAKPLVVIPTPRLPNPEQYSS